MTFLERARERAMAAAEQVRVAAGQGPPRSGEAGGSGGDATAGDATAGDATAGAATALAAPGAGSARDALQHGLGSARAGLSQLVDRLDPGLVADVIIKATSLQEHANAALRAKGSAYRIDGVSITATIPPQISFSIGRSAAEED